MKDILGAFSQFRAAAGLSTEEESSNLTVEAAKLKASVAPTVAKYQALASLAESDATLYEAAGDSFNRQLLAKVSNLEVDANVAEVVVAAEQRFYVSQERLSAVNATMAQLASKYSQILAGGGQRAIVLPAQKQLPWS